MNIKFYSRGSESSDWSTHWGNHRAWQVLYLAQDHPCHKVLKNKTRFEAAASWSQMLSLIKNSCNKKWGNGLFYSLIPTLKCFMHFIYARCMKSTGIKNTVIEILAACSVWWMWSAHGCVSRWRRKQENVWARVNHRPYFRRIKLVETVSAKCKLIQKVYLFRSEQSLFSPPAASARPQRTHRDNLVNVWIY